MHCQSGLEVLTLKRNKDPLIWTSLVESSPSLLSPFFQTKFDMDFNKNIVVVTSEIKKKN